MAGKVKDITGNQYGRLTVLRLDHVDKKLGAYWACRCICDDFKIVVVSSDSLRKGMTKSCGCLQTEVQRDRNRLEYGRSCKNRVFSGYKKGAEEKGLLFEISFQEFLNMSQEKCFYCGNPPNNIRREKNGYGDFIYNGIDRIDNTLGYIKGNMVPCCKICNMGKRAMTKDDFFKWIKSIYENSDLKNYNYTEMV